jgi:putative lipoprotein
MVEIDREKSIEVVADYGEKKASTPVPAPRDSAGTTIYEASTEATRLTIHIREAACHDAMSGEAMTHSVTMILNGTEYRGCGRYLGDRG